jgi:hypothetical protein
MKGSKATRGSSQGPLDALRAGAYRIPADAPEADGTFAWEARRLRVEARCV